jgi:hypothetical protein
MSFEFMKAFKEAQPGTDQMVRACVSSLLLGLILAAGPAVAGSLDIGVDLGIGSGSGGGLSAGVDVGIGGGSGAEVGVDIGLGGGAGTGGPGTDVPGGPGVVDPKNPVVASGQGGANGMVCAKDGNETAYNGFVVRDRSGELIGWVHEATVSPNGKVLVVRMQATDKSCYKLANAGFRIKGEEVWANVDATVFR